MITVTGKLVNPMDLKPEDICLDDIVHGLSNTCRFGGQSPRFYSVAEHTLWVTSMVPAPLKIHALMHDFAEAYLMDVIRPIKSNLFFAPAATTGYFNIDHAVSYREVEKKALRVIYEALEVPEPTKEQAYDIKQADGLVLRAELLYLFGKTGKELLQGDAELPTLFSPTSYPGNPFNCEFMSRVRESDFLHCLYVENKEYGEYLKNEFNFRKL